MRIRNKLFKILEIVPLVIFAWFFVSGIFREGVNYPSPIEDLLLWAYSILPFFALLEFYRKRKDMDKYDMLLGLWVMLLAVFVLMIIFASSFFSQAFG